MDGRAVGQHRICLFLQLQKFIIKLVIFKITHELFVFLVIGFGCLTQDMDQLFHSVKLIFHGSVPLLTFLFPPA